VVTLQDSSHPSHGVRNDDVCCQRIVPKSILKYFNRCHNLSATVAHFVEVFMTITLILAFILLSFLTMSHTVSIVKCAPWVQTQDTVYRESEWTRGPSPTLRSVVLTECQSCGISRRGGSSRLMIMFEGYCVLGILGMCRYGVSIWVRSYAPVGT
jgi:hypothetical protein